MKAKQLSEIIISYLDSKGDLITNKKLQKLLYYVEAWFLVYSKSIVDEDFEAWVHGPVIPSVYQVYRKFGYSPIKQDYKKGEHAEGRYNQLLIDAGLKKEQKKLLDAILSKYAPLTSYQLEILSHSETPWKKAREGYPQFSQCSDIITKSSIKKYYSSLVKG